MPELLEQSWREAIAGLLASTGLLVLVFPLSFSLLPAILLAGVSYVGLRLVLAPAMRTSDSSDPTTNSFPIVVDPLQLPTVPVAPVAAASLGPTSGPPPFGLTRRELEILPLLAQRLTDSEIADRLSISPRTVMNHVASILGKLGLKSRREVAAFLEQHRDLFRFPPENRDR